MAPRAQGLDGEARETLQRASSARGRSSLARPSQMDIWTPRRLGGKSNRARRHQAERQDTEHVEGYDGAPSDTTFTESEGP